MFVYLDDPWEYPILFIKNHQDWAKIHSQTVYFENFCRYFIPESNLSNLGQLLWFDRSYCWNFCLKMLSCFFPISSTVYTLYLEYLFNRRTTAHFWLYVLFIFSLIFPSCFYKNPIIFTQNIDPIAFLFHLFCLFSSKALQNYFLYWCLFNHSNFNRKLSPQDYL